ncbi:MAG: hypothetical protein ABIT37_07325 [Luteolibacter sp.]
MKIIFTIVCYFVFLSTVWSKGDASPMMVTAFGIASEAGAGFEATGTWPPMEKFTSVEQYALRKKEPGELVIFNTMACVPGTPLIKAEGVKAEGVKAEYSGFRLYAISRIPNLDKAYTPEQKKEGGRFAILFKEKEGKITNLETLWIIESEAQKILQQIGGFDPKKSPFVFEETYVKLGGDLKWLYQNNNPEKYVKRRFSPAEESHSKLNPAPSSAGNGKSLPNSGPASVVNQFIRWWWLVIGILIFAGGFVWLRRRK